MTSLSGRPVATTLVWTLLLFLLPLAPVFGSAASIAASATAILLAAATIRDGGWTALRAEPAMWIFATVLVALAAAFAITANDARDPLFAFNFVSLLLAAPVFVAASRMPARDTITAVAILCLGGTIAAALVAANDVLVLGNALVRGLGMGPHVIGRIALTMAFIALAALFVVGPRAGLLLYAAPVLALVVIWLSGTRGAALALPVLALIYVAFLVADPRYRRHGLVLAGLAAIGTVALALASDRVASIVGIALRMLSGAPVGDGSVVERVQMLEAAWTLFVQSPIVGHGWGNFAGIAHPILGPVVWGGPTDPFFQFHNDLANFAVAAGIIGVLCWAALLAAPVVGALASRRDALFGVRLYCCVQLSAGYFVVGLTDLTLGYDLPTTLYAFLTAIVLGAFRERPWSAGIRS